MNDFNDFLSLLRDQQPEKENKQEKPAAPVRTAIPMRGELAKPIGADMSEFMEAVEDVKPFVPQAPVRKAEVKPEEKAVKPLVVQDAAPQEVQVPEKAVDPVVAQESVREANTAQQKAESFRKAVEEKTRVVTNLADVPVTTDENPAPGSVSAAGTVVFNDPRAAAQADIAGPGATRHISAAGMFAPEKPVAGSSQPVDGKTKHIGEGKGSLLRAIAKTARESDQAEGQIVMEGFDSNDPVQTDVQTMEEELRTVREKRIEDFGLLNNLNDADIPEHAEPPKTKTIPLPGFLAGIADKFADKQTPFAAVKADEYKMHEERRRVTTQLRDGMRQMYVLTGVQFALGLILILANLITTLSANANNGFFTVFGANVKAYAVFNLVFFLASAVLLLPDFKNAVFTVLKLRARTEAALLGMYMAVLMQNISLFFTELQPEHDYHVFTGACVLLGALYTASKIFWIKNTRYCFKQAGVSENKLYLRSIRDSHALRRLLCENNVDGVCVDFSVKTAFISDFLSRSADAARSAMPRSVLTPVLAVLSVICGIAAAVIHGSPVCGISAAAGAACLSFPVCGVVAGALLLCETNRALSAKKAYINSLRDAHNVVTSDHIAFGGKDLFRVKIVKTATVDLVSEKAAAVTAAILAKKAGDTLAAAFGSMLVDYNKRLPEVEEFAVEEKLGVSAWIDNCRVLLGTSEMLVNHNIQPGKLPAPAENEHYLYLAIEGNAVAVFTLQYTCRENLSKSLGAVAQTGVNLLIRTSDPNLTVDMIQRAASLPENSVRIVPKAGGEMFDRIYDRVSEKANAGIVGAGGFGSLCDAIGASVDLDRSGKMVSYVCTASAVVGMGAALLLCVTGSIGKVSGWSAVLLQIIWNAAAIFLPQLLGKLSGVKNNRHGRRAAGVAFSKMPQTETTVPPEDLTLAQDSEQKTEKAEHLDFVLSNGFSEEMKDSSEE